MDAAEMRRQTELAFREAGAEPDTSYLDDAFFASLDQVPEMTVEGEPDAPENWAYYWVRGHTVAFTGGPGTLCYYKYVSGTSTCTTQAYRALQWGRELTAYRCGGTGSYIWRIKERMYVPPV
jgi:hypothetical protein